jgi:hypothetical protein
VAGAGPAEDGVDSMSNVSTLEYYGKNTDPCLDADSAAIFVGCAKHTIYRAELRDEIQAVPHRSKKTSQYIRTYRLSELQALKEKRQQDPAGVLQN